MALTQEQLQSFKSALEQERARLVDERNAYDATLRDDPQQQDFGELSDYDPNDPGDEGSNLFDRDREMAAFENTSRLLAKVDRALAKIEEGTYGLSDIDGTPIPVERLEAIPYAVTTVEQEEAF